MHGRKREPKGPVDPAKAEARRRKAALYAELSRAALAARKVGAGAPLEAGAQLLALNPEVYTLWNHRKEAVGPALAEGGQRGAEAAAAELALVQAALMRNPKSYCTWQHRKWVVGHQDCGVDLARELALCAQLLAADDRNFHCWSYRRHVAALARRTADQELDFTTAKIEENFSNYSAWHYRTALLPRAYPPAVSFEQLAGEGFAEAGGGNGGGEGGGTGDRGARGSDPSAPAPASGIPDWVLDEEYELVKQAFYTEPADQSAWMYHRWLLGCTLAKAHGGPEGEGKAAARRVLAREAGVCRELLEIEPDSKWALLTLARLTQAVAQLGPEETGGSVDAGEVGEIYRRLAAEIDPDRKGYYRMAVEEECTCLPKPAAG